MDALMELLLKQEKRLETIEDLLSSQKSVLNIDEVCRITSKSKSHIYKLTCSGSIPYYKQGKHLYFDRQEIESWLKSNRIKSMEEIESEASTYVTINRKGSGR